MGYSLSITIEGSGSVAKNPNKAFYNSGETVQLTATADPEWIFSSWSGSLTGDQNPADLFMDGDKTVTASFIQPNYNDIVFDSSFDMGNLINVQFQSGDSSGHRFYTAKNDYSTVGFADKHWWFYYSMENTAGKIITVQLQNLESADFTGNRWNEIEPVYSYDNINWERVPLSDVVADGTARTFTITVTPTQNKIWLAPLPPYPVWKRDALFTEFSSSPYLTVSSLGTTPGGQELKVATITDPTYNDANKFKAYVIAQQHSGEIPGSWNAEGMIRFLLSDDPTAQSIRKSYIFKIVPITNVDGVYYGRSRYTPLRSGTQYDLNRLWNNPDTAQPEVNWIFHDMETWQPDCYNDLHSTINTEVGSPKEALTYSWSTSDPTVIAFRNSLKLGGWPETVTGVTGYGCIYVHSLLGVIPSVSFENPHDELSTNPGVKLTVNDWMNWGKGYAKGVYLYFGDVTGTVTVSSVGSGSVTKTPDNAFYTYGTSVQLAALPDSGWKFSYWTGDLTGSDNPAFITVTGDLTIQAHFDLENTYTITATAGTGGSINPSGAVSVNHGADQTFTIAADTGYHIADVSADSVSQGATSTYTFYTVDSDHTITASFAINQYTITAIAETGGTITPSGAVSVNYGADQAFTIAADTGYHIADVSVDSVSQGAISTYTFSTVDSDHTITASFASDQLFVDSIFDASTDSADLRANTAGQDWYESRGGFTGGDATLLTLDTNNIGGNTGKKAGLKSYGTTSKNAYLTQEFISPQSGTFTVSFDIYTDRIEATSTNNRGAHIYIGDDSVTTNAPTGTANERFVYLAFYDPTPGDTGNDLEIRARTLSTQAYATTSQWIQVASELSYDTWYTVKLVVKVASNTYDVYVNDVLKMADVSKYAGYITPSVGYIVFVADSDGRGDHYIDNVYSPAIN